MRYFYLRAADPVKNFYAGRTKCRHQPAKMSTSSTGVARDCLKCWRELIAKGEPSPKPDSLVGCIVSELVGDTVYFAVSVCSTKDTWVNKEYARDIAKARLANREALAQRTATRPTKPVPHQLLGQVGVNEKPVKITVLKMVANDPMMPKHARAAAEQWLMLHPERPVEDKS